MFVYISNVNISGILLTNRYIFTNIGYAIKSEYFLIDENE